MTKHINSLPNLLYMPFRGTLYSPQTAADALNPPKYPPMILMKPPK